MLNLQPFKEQYMHPRGDAQVNLRGRSHYVDDETLRYFKARINYARPHCGGLLYAIVESFECFVTGEDHEVRRHRGVVFDITGSIVYHPTSDESFKTSKAAQVAMQAFIDSFDAIKQTRESLDWKLKMCRYSIEYARKWAGEIAKEVQA
jgi:hypothetical protein